MCWRTTTLYAGLQMLASDTTRKVLTIEDPIEFAIPGIQQAHELPDAQLVDGLFDGELPPGFTSPQRG